MTVDSAILAVVVAFLLPLRLLALALRLTTSGRGFSAGALRRTCASLSLTAALLAAIFALPPRDHARECAAPPGVAYGGRDDLRVDVEHLKLQLARLVLDDKGDALEDKDDRVMRALELDIQSLIDEQMNMKAWSLRLESLCSSHDDNIRTVENEVQILKDESRKMSSDIYNVHSLAKDTTERVEALHLDIKKVQVITDEWRKMNSTINRIWSFAKDTEQRVEGLYSDIKKGFKKTKRKMPFWTD